MQSGQLMYILPFWPNRNVTRPTGGTSGAVPMGNAEEEDMEETEEAVGRDEEFLAEDPLTPPGGRLFWALYLVMVRTWRCVLVS